jgi:hypothetical protein
MHKKNSNEQLAIKEDSSKNSGKGLLSFEALKGNIETLIKSGSLPADCKTQEAVYMKMSYGAELGFKPVESLHLLTMISGTQTVNAKGISRLFALNGYKFRLIKNAEFIYFGEGKTCYSDRLLSIGEIISKLGITPEQFKQLHELKQAAIGKPLDRETEIEYGLINSNNENEVVWQGTHKYFWSDAVASELASKETFKKYPKDMMLHRCKVGLSKVLGILTAPEMEEWATVKNVETTVIDGEVTIVE